MFGKMKAGLASAQEKVAEKKAEMAEKKQNKWAGEVLKDDSPFFLSFKEWSDLYEPKGEKKEGGSEKKGPNAVQKKLYEKISTKVTKKTMRALTDVAARPLDIAAEALKTRDVLLAKIFNSLEAVVLTYRFQYKSKDKFAYLRLLAVDRLVAAVLEALDAEALKAGHNDPAGLSPADVDKIVAVLVGKVNTEFESRQATMTAALKESPLFSAAPAEGQAKAEEGVAVILGFVRGYVEKKMAIFTEVLSKALTVLSKVAVTHRKAVQANIAANHGPEEASEEYVKGARAEALKEIEGSYAKVHDEVYNFIHGLLCAADGDGDDEDDE